MRHATRAHGAASAGIFVLLACGCSSAPLEGETARRMVAGEPLPRVVGLEVDCEGERLFGSREEWTEDLVRVLEQLDVCTDIRTAAGATPRADCDMLVTVSILRRGRPRGPSADDAGFETHVETQGSVLGVVAWSTVPLLPWWIDDVSVDPDLLVRIDRSLPEAAGEIQWSTDARPIRVPPVQTCFLDRHDFLSWETLGAVFVPPFVFDDPDEEQLVEAIGPRLREELAIQVAAIIKGSSLSFELLRNVRVEGDAADGFFLAYQSSPELASLEVHVDPDRSPRIVKNVVETEREAAGRLPLGTLTKTGSIAGRILRIEALGKSGSLVRYSVNVPEGARVVGSD